MEIWNKSKGVRIAWEVETADTFWSRLRGWMGRAVLPPGSALVIRPCNSIHTFFMKQPIDVVFLDREERVIRMLHGIAPGRVSSIVKQASAVVELPAGTLSGTGTECADTFAIGRIS